MIEFFIILYVIPLIITLSVFVYRAITYYQIDAEAVKQHRKFYDCLIRITKDDLNESPNNKDNQDRLVYLMKQRERFDLIPFKSTVTFYLSGLALFIPIINCSRLIMHIFEFTEKYEYTSIFKHNE